jgi:single-strand DNA-binding protein
MNPMNGLHSAAVGRIGRDGEIKYTPSGLALLTFTLAVEDQKKREGDETQWLKISVWGERAEALADQVKKGALWYVEGRTKVRTWTTQSGETRAELELSAWRCEPLFAIGRSAVRRSVDDVGAERTRRMPESVAVGGGRDIRHRPGLDDHPDPDDATPF